MQKKSRSKGFEKLLNVHTKALEDNSESIVEILEILSKKLLSAVDKNSINKIRKDIKSIDSKIDSLGANADEEEEKWWF